MEVESNVCLLARSVNVPVVASLSKGSFPFCHWGVLVTEKSPETLTRLLEYNPDADVSTALGTLYQLQRTPEDENNHRVSQPFTISESSEEWPRLCWTRVGTTRISHDQIKAIGCFQCLLTDQIAFRITQERKDYRVITNNCQNFAQWLIEEISPGAHCPDTIQALFRKVMPSRPQSLGSTASFRSSIATVFSASTNGTSLSSVPVHRKTLPSIPKSATAELILPSTLLGLKSPMNAEAWHAWGMIKTSLPDQTRKDIQKWGHPLLCDIFEVVVLPIRAEIPQPVKEQPPRWERLSYCVLYSSKLAFFLPRYHQSAFTLIGVINICDITHPHLKPLLNNHASSNKTNTGFMKLELFVTHCDTSSSIAVEERLSLVSVMTEWSVADRTIPWHTKMKDLLNRETPVSEDRHSFLYSQVLVH